MGNGNLYHTVFDTLATAASQGLQSCARLVCPVVQPQKVLKLMTLNTALSLRVHNPQARVLLRLALTQTQNHKKFKSYSTHIDTVSLLRRRRSSQNFRQTFIATPLLILQFIRSRTIDRMVLVISEGEYSLDNINQNMVVMEWTPY